MLTLTQQEYIKFLRERETLSISEISKRVDVDWRTAKKYADKEDWNIFEASGSTNACKVMDPFMEIVRTWITEDKLMPVKQRHTAKRIYERLKNQHGYTGSERTVRTHVARIKTEIFSPLREVSVKLDHPPGEAQADFGTMRAYHDGMIREFKYLVVTFPFSNAGFVQLYPGENAQCFLDGLRRIFEFVGGVPTKLRIDNLSAAVAKILEGTNRQETEVFKRFRMHYRFKAQFCNPAAGNEKGNCENKVGTFRRNQFVPMPSVNDLVQFNTQLFDQCIQDLESVHYERKEWIKDLFQNDKAHLLRLPSTPFEAVRLDTAVVNNYGQINFDGFTYDSIPAKPGEGVRIKATWNELEIILRHETIARKERQYGYKREPIDWLYHFNVLRTKPRALEYSMYRTFLPEKVHSYLLVDVDLATRKERLNNISKWLINFSLEKIDQSLGSLSKLEWGKTAWIEHKLYQQSAIAFSPLSENYTPEGFKHYNPDPKHYNALVPEVNAS